MCEMELSRRAFLLGGVPALGAVLVRARDALGQNFGPGRADDYFRFEWRKTGRTISGYVYNSSNRWAARVQLLVEGVDRSGKVVNKTTTWVAGGIPANNRAFFEVAVPEAASYRLRVLSYEWVDRRDLRSL